MKTIATLLGIPLALSACGAPSDREDKAASAPVASASAPSTFAASASTPSSSGSTPVLPSIDAANASPSTAAIRSCRAEIGAAASTRLVDTCRDVSPATRPPCDAANSCALIEDEIARSCALFDGEAPPMKGCTPAPQSMAAAADVVRRYYAAIDARDFATAWSQWGDDGQRGRTFAAFQAGFADTRAVRVAIGRMAPSDAGAGSVYQPVPVTVDSTLADGRRLQFVGTYVVRRVNGVDGASPSQRRWHLDSASLKPAAAR